MQAIYAEFLGECYEVAIIQRIVVYLLERGAAITTNTAPLRHEYKPGSEGATDE